MVNNEAFEDMLEVLKANHLLNLGVFIMIDIPEMLLYESGLCREVR